MIQKGLLALIGLVAVATVTACAVAAAAFALFAWLAGLIGPAGAAALTALALSLLLAILVLAMGRPEAVRPQEEHNMTHRAIEFARERPMAAAAAAVAVGVVLFRNPKLLATAASAFLAGRKSGKN